MAADGFRLPTEAEWEYAARAGQDASCSGSDDPDEVAWYAGNAEERTRPVGLKRPNAWGLYDMSGNVWEWVWDGFGPFQAGLAVDPVGPATCEARVGRGGSAWSARWGLRPSDRVWYNPAHTNYSLGFRVARWVGGGQAR